ncbi:MAG: GNAT family N-acetyltransferase [Kiloniellaceae bacterium]
MTTRHDVPVLTTERLVLRGHTADDFTDYAALRADPEVVRYITGKPSTPSESWSRLQSSAGHWALLGFGFWAVEERASGRFVGEGGLGDFKRDIEPGFDGAPEAGWVLAPWSHGKGYATEAVKAALAWGEQSLAMTRCVCMIDPVHAASLRVAEKCGFTPFAETTFKESPVVLLERLK